MPDSSYFEASKARVALGLLSALKGHGSRIRRREAARVGPERGRDPADESALCNSVWGRLT
jgi:hypothetical protein